MLIPMRHGHATFPARSPVDAADRATDVHLTDSITASHVIDTWLHPPFCIRSAQSPLSRWSNQQVRITAEYSAGPACRMSMTH